jgi:hypothetical protein
MHLRCKLANRLANCQKAKVYLRPLFFGYFFFGYLQTRVMSDPITAAWIATWCAAVFIQLLLVSCLWVWGTRSAFYVVFAFISKRRVDANIWDKTCDTAIVAQDNDRYGNLSMRLLPTPPRFFFLLSPPHFCNIQPSCDLEYASECTEIGDVEQYRDNLWFGGLGSQKCILASNWRSRMILMTQGTRHRIILNLMYPLVRWHSHVRSADSCHTSEY